MDDMFSFNPYTVHQHQSFDNQQQSYDKQHHSFDKQHQSYDKQLQLVDKQPQSFEEFNKKQQLTHSNTYETPVNNTQLVEHKSNPSEQELYNFKKIVKLYLTCDDKIKESRKITKTYNAQLKKYKSYIMNFMEKYNVENLESSDSRLKFSKSTRKKPVNKKIVQNKLTEYLGGNYQKAQEITKFIVDNNEVVETNTLKRIMKKDRKLNINI